MSQESEFRILYDNPRDPVPAPERYEGYDLESAFYDHLPSGVHAQIRIGGYGLEMTDVRFVDLVRSSLTMAEQLATLPADASGQLRTSMSELPPKVKAYYWLFGDFVTWLPVIVFATDGTKVWIYTRTRAEADGGPLITWAERDEAQPVVVDRSAAIGELVAFLSRYVSDLLEAFPFLVDDEMFLRFGARLRALQPACN